MKVRAQVAMVLNLDKCIGCHTCSVTCKNVWTSREGVEYAWFNNVETKPGIGFPKEWENQKKWNGGWRRKKNGKIEPRIGNRWRVLVVEGEGLVVVVDLRQVRIGEDVGEDPPFGAHLRLDPAVTPAPPPAVPPLLVLPFAGIADARLGLHIVEPGVFDAFAVGPHVLAGDRTGVAADALVEVQHHRDLGTDLHSAASVVSASSSQSTFAILRRTTNSSRLAPTVP